MFAPGTGLYTLAGDVTQPIFEGFTLLNKQKAAEAGLGQAEAQYRQAVITAFQNVADAYARAGGYESGEGRRLRRGNGQGEASRL